jgi:hypothetical protein
VPQCVVEQVVNHPGQQVLVTGEGARGGGDGQGDVLSVGPGKVRLDGGVQQGAEVDRIAARS